MNWTEYADALRGAASAKSEALALDKKRRRIRHQCFIAADGTVNAREAEAGIHPAYVAAEDAWIEAETAYNLAQAEADVLRIRFEAWRSMQALEREKISKGIYAEGRG